MIAKLITVAQTREEAINTMERALSEFVVVCKNHHPFFHQQLMRNEDFRNGNYTTKFPETFGWRSSKAGTKFRDVGTGDEGRNSGT